MSRAQLEIPARAFRCTILLLALAATHAVAQTPGTNNGASRNSAEARLPVQETGVVVERIQQNFAAARAGVVEGDVLLGWTGATASGTIASPFVLNTIEAEQSPLGTVTVHGQRDDVEHHWALGQGKWGIETRPLFEGELLSTYKQADALLATKQFAAAARTWASASTLLPHSQRDLLDTWFFFHAALVSVAAHDWEDADQAFKSALDRATNVSSAVRTQIARAWGFAYQQRNDWLSALKYYRLALDEDSRKDPASLEVASRLNDLGIVASFQGDIKGAEEYYTRALAIRRKLAPGSFDLSVTLLNLGNMARKRGDLKQAEQYQQEALAIRQRLVPGTLDEAASFNNLGNIAMDMGDLEKAERYHKQALSIREKLAPNSLDVAGSLNNLGIVALALGNDIQAEDYYRRTYDIAQRLSPDSLNVAATVTNLAALSSARGDFDATKKYLEEAVTIREKLAPESVELAGNLIDLGAIEASHGNFGRATKLTKRSLVITSKAAPNGQWVAQSLNALGEISRDSGKVVAAQTYFKQALALREKFAPDTLEVAATLQALGDTARMSGNLTSAEQYYRRALAIRSKEAPDTDKQAESFGAIARLYRMQGKLPGAADLFERCLNALESQTARLGGAEDVRSAFRAQHLSYYREYMDVLIAQRKPEQAFRVLERSRARSLLETLAHGRVDIHKGIDPVLLERERQLKHSIAEASEHRAAIVAETRDQKGLAAVDREISALSVEYRDLEARIRDLSPNYAALTQPSPIDSKQVESALDPGTLLLEFALGADQSYAFVVTGSAVTVKPLRPRAQIEAVARALYSAMKRQGSAPSQQISRLSADLSRLVLSPIAVQISAAKRLAIVADGALQYTAFSALPLPKELARPKRSLLVDAYEIVNLPSAAVLAVVRAGRARDVSANKLLAVFADPVFDSRDERVRLSERHEHRGQVASATRTSAQETSTQNEIVEQSVQRSARQAGVSASGYLPRLPFTRREAQAIYAVAAPGTASEALDFDATKQRAISPELKQYKILHFATHGLLNSEHPELSGLVFSLVDRNGNAQDGFLRLLDIYNLDLNADVVVLSACQTALGKEVSGEGLVGLTRGFIYAGAPRVIASLWNVDDEATAQLMGKLYEGMLRDHKTPARALRDAQQWLSRQPRWKSPYFWAGFTLQGDWR